MNPEGKEKFIRVLLEEWNKGTGAVHSRVLEERTGASHADTDAFLTQLRDVNGVVRAHLEPGNPRGIIVTGVDSARLR